MKKSQWFIKLEGLADSEQKYIEEMIINSKKLWLSSLAIVILNYISFRPQNILAKPLWNKRMFKEAQDRINFRG